tara:strand:- start:442 stop:1149 length:708 start_codon:yes stop_codon:yes gene_type:complete
MNLEQIQELAGLAVPTNDTDEGSYRQLGAEYQFFAAVENVIGKHAMNQGEDDITAKCDKNELIKHYLDIVELYYENSGTPILTMLPVTPHEMIILDRVLKDYYDYLTTQDDYGSHDADIAPTASLLTKIDSDEKIDDTLLEQSTIAIESTRRLCSIPVATQLGGLDLGVGDNGTGTPVYFAWHKNIARADAIKLIQTVPDIQLIYDIDRDLYSTRIDTDLAIKFIPVSDPFGQEV